MQDKKLSDGALSHIPAGDNAFVAFWREHHVLVTSIAQDIQCIDQAIHWELVDDLKGALGSDAANASSDSEEEQDNALDESDEWVSQNCSDHGVEVDVAMALWLKGLNLGKDFIYESVKPSVSADTP